MTRKRGWSLLGLCSLLLAGSVCLPGSRERGGHLAPGALMAAGSERPDLLIGSGAGGSITYRGDNIYQSEPSEEQAEKATLAPQGSAAYEVLVQNDGQAPRRFVVAATESADAGWEISYKAGGVEITEEILGPSGYVTEEIAPGASEAISLVLSPAADAEPGSGAGSVVQVSLDADGSAPLDAVAATAALEGVATRAASRAVSQPDLLIKDLDEPTSAFAINGTYQTSPSGAQIETQAVSPGSKASYTVLIENDGSAAQSYVLRASESSETGWTVVYRQGLTDITAAIKGRGGFATAVLNPGSSTSIVVEITAGAGVFGGSSKSAFVRAFLSSTDTTVDDSVRAFAFVPIVDRVDLLIKDSFEPSSAFAINNVYQSSPSGDQIETQSVAAGGTATYNVLVQNDGNRRRSFVLKAAQSRASGWTVVYKSGATDITSQILSSTGFTTIALSPGFGTIITVQMTPATTVFGGSLRSSLIRAHFSTSETTVRDSVSAISSVPVIDRPDLLIKSAAQASTSFAIDNTYQTTPSGDQVETQFVTGGLTASYNVMLQNDGNRPRAYVLKAAESSETGWTVRYRLGATDITSSILSANGFITQSLVPGGSLIITVSLTPSGAVRGGTSKSTNIRAHLTTSETTVRDVVRAFAFVPVITRPDLLIKDSFESSLAFALNNVYQSTPSGAQIESQLVNAGNKATFSLLLQNDGNTTRSFVLKATESAGAGWTVVYKAGATDITAAITGAGHTTPLLSPGVGQLLSVEITAGATLPASSIKRVFVSAFLSGSDTTANDAVEARAIVDRPGRPDLLIKDAQEPDSDFALDNVYQTTPAGNQIESESTPVGTAAVFHVRVQNDGTSARSFVLRALESATAGWIVTYQIGASNITAAIKGSGGHSLVLGAGGFTTLIVSMTPTAGAPAGVTKQSLVRVHLNETDTIVRDSVRAVALPD